MFNSTKTRLQSRNTPGKRTQDTLDIDAMAAKGCLLAQCLRRMPFSDSTRRSQTQRSSHRMAVHAIQIDQRASAADAAQVDRRSLLAAAAAGMLMTVQGTMPRPAAAEEAVAAGPAVKELQGKAGFRFSYPDGWVVGFNRGDQSGALALVGDFKSFDTASVLKADLPRLMLPPETAEKGDVKALASALIAEARSTGSTMSFELVNEGTERRGGGNYIVFEYVLSICNGEIEEGLEGKRRCLAPNGNSQEPITRHLVASATFKDGQAYLLTASSPIERWPQTADQLRAVAESFQVD